MKSKPRKERHMRRFSTTIVLALASLLFVSICSAQQASTTAVPNLIRYGGTLKDAQGAALSSSTAVGVTFSIYKQQDGGAPVWMETQNVTPDASGQYSVVLGSTTATGLPGDLFSQEEQRWLGVQVAGQTEQPRVLLVSVPYAFKAHEAETLAGKSISDFVLAKDLNSNGGEASAASPSQTTTPSSAGNSPANHAAVKTGVASQGPTNFSGSTTDQIVGVTQSGTGAGINVSASGNAVVGTSTTGAAYAVYGLARGVGGFGVLGNATATTGYTVGVKGGSVSTSGTGVRGLDTATTGNTTGISAYVASPAGTAGVFNNAAGGKIISGQNNGAEKFSVDGSGNVNSISGTYKIGGSSVLNIGSPADSNLFLGVGAGVNDVAGSGYENTFSGSGAGHSNTTGYGNTFSGAAAGYSNTTGVLNTFSGALSGYRNTTGIQNTFSGSGAGGSNSSGSANTFSGLDAGYSNTIGNHNSFFGVAAGYSNTSGGANTFIGFDAGESNTLGERNTFVGHAAGFSNIGDNQGNGSGNAFFGFQAGYSNTFG
jgi:hypothetical protein